MSPTASIVIPSYRGETKLPILLQALKRQDTRDFEAIVVVDGRLDRSPEIIEAARADLPVRALVLEKNQGRVAALTAGFASATGEVLIRCDDDLEPGPDYVSAHIARHEAAAAPIGVVGLTRDILPDSPYARAYGRARASLSVAAAYRGSLPTWRHWAANCSLARETWQRVGPYDAAYQHYGWEDVDMGYRLHAAGIPIIIAPELETPHLGAATSVRSRTMRAYHSGAARRTFNSHHPGALEPPTAGSGPWGRLVSSMASRGDEAWFNSTSRAVDAVLPVVPAAIGEKLAALAVESASLAGYSHPDSVSTRF